MNQKEIKNYIGTIAVLAVFIALAVSVVLLIVAGTSVFNRLSYQNENSYDKRTISRFIANKIDSADKIEDIFVQTYGDTSAVGIRQNYSTGEYITIIYCCDGYLRELFLPENAVVELRSGEKIIKCSELNPDMNNGLLTIDVVLSSDEHFRLIYDVSGGNLK